MCFPLNRSLSKYTSHSEFLTPLEFVLFFENGRHILLYLCYSSTRCTATKQQITTPKFLVFEVLMIRCRKLFEIKKLGLKEFLHGIQWTQKREKSVKYPCRSLARNSKKYRRTEGYNLLHQSKHLLPSWKLFNVQLAQVVWISFENPLNGLNPCVTLRDKMVWQEG